MNNPLDVQEEWPGIAPVEQLVKDSSPLNRSDYTDALSFGVDHEGVPMYDVLPTLGETRNIDPVNKRVVRFKPGLGETSNFRLLRTFTAGGAIAEGDAVALVTSNSNAIDLERSSSQYLSVADTAPLSVTGNLTIEAVVKFETIDTGNTRKYTIASKWKTIGDQRSYIFSYNEAATPEFHFQVSSGGTGGTSTDVGLAYALTAGTTYHVAMVYTAATPLVEFFVDGVSVGTQNPSQTSIFDGTAAFMIGNIDGGTDYMDGVVDEVRVWNITRTAAQLLASKDNELISTESGLVGYWKLNNDLTDSTTNAATLTNNGSATFVTGLFGNASSLTVRKANATVVSLADSFVGFAYQAIASGMDGEVAIAGVIDGFTGLSPGRLYYLSNTAGGISTSAGSVTRKVALALSASEVLITNLW